MVGTSNLGSWNGHWSPGFDHGCWVQAFEANYSIRAWGYSRGIRSRIWGIWLCFKGFQNVDLHKLSHLYGHRRMQKTIIHYWFWEFILELDNDMNAKFWKCLCGPAMILAAHLLDLVQFCCLEVQQYKWVCICCMSLCCNTYLMFWCIHL